ncbi:MAG TPA: response regulator [Candidatus Acidoferrales bacterium]|nr:response regulator [Candidatus Acidoferrales bacterium]
MTAEAASRRKVFVIDEDRSFRTIVARNLELAGFDIVECVDGPSALTLLQVQCPDLVLVDAVLPRMGGLEVTRRIRKMSGCAHVPVILLTPSDEKAGTIAALEAGADDCISKPFSPDEMLARIRSKIRRVADAAVQPLTKLPGNLAIEREIRLRFESAAQWSLLYADLDYFKSFNDRYGFARGDDAIQLLGVILTDVTRTLGGEGDFVGHVGGDDFVVITTPGTDVRIADRAIGMFDRDIRVLYDFDDLERGAIETTDRSGARAEFPIMSVSVAIVSNQDRAFTSYQQVGEIAAELKKHAKSIEGSVWVKDQRRA